MAKKSIEMNTLRTLNVAIDNIESTLESMQNVDGADQMVKYHQISIEEYSKRLDECGTCARCDHAMAETCMFAATKGITSCIAFVDTGTPCNKCSSKRKCKKNHYICDAAFWCADGTDVPKNPTTNRCASCEFDFFCAVDGKLGTENCTKYRLKYLK